MGTFSRKPIIKFDSLTDVGVDKLSLGSTVTYTDSTGNNALIEILDITGMIETSTLAEFLATPANYKHIATDIVGAPNFLTLSDTPVNYTGKIGQTLVVNATEDGVIFGPAANGVTTLEEMTDTNFTSLAADNIMSYNGTKWINIPLPVTISNFMSLADTPVNYTGSAGKVLAVNAGETGVEYISIPVPVFNLSELTDTTFGTLSTDDILTYNGTNWINKAPVVPVLDFISLSDTPVNFTGNTGKVLTVNAAESALEFGTAGDVSTGLEKIEGDLGFFGWRLVGMTSATHGTIGMDAIDLSTVDITARLENGDLIPEMGTFGATGMWSTTVGRFNIASGSASCNIGYYNITSAQVTNAFGTKLNAAVDYMTAVGIANVGTNILNSFEIGIGGPDPQNPSATINKNGLEITKTGGIIAPEFLVTEITTPKHLITKEYFDSNNKIISIEGGYALSSIDTNNIGTIGTNAVNLCTSENASSTVGSTGLHSFSTGEDTTASGTNSSVFGKGTIASNESSLSLGKYNVGTNTNNILEIGNGTSLVKHNALEVANSGLVTVSSTINDIDSGSDLVLVTKEWVQGIIEANKYIHPSLTTHSEIPTVQTATFVVNFPIDEKVLVMIDGIIQDENTYTVIGSQITFAVPLEANQALTIFRGTSYNIHSETSTNASGYTITPSFTLLEGTAVFFDGMLQDETAYSIAGNDITINIATSSVDIKIINTSFSFINRTNTTDITSNGAGEDVIETTFVVNHDTIMFMDGIYTPLTDFTVIDNTINIGTQVDGIDILILKG